MAKSNPVDEAVEEANDADDAEEGDNEEPESNKESDNADEESDSHEKGEYNEDTNEPALGSRRRSRPVHRRAM